MQLITEKYKVDIKNYMWRLMMDLNENLKKYDKRYFELTSQTEKIFYQQEESVRQMKQYNQMLEINRIEMATIQEEHEKFKNLTKVERRVDQLENELEQMRRMMNSQANDYKDKLTLAVTQRQVEETILKFNFDMLNDLLESRGADKITPPSDLGALFQNKLQWQYKIKQLFEKGQAMTSEKGAIDKSLVSF